LAAFNPALFVSGGRYLPFVSVASGSTDVPFLNVPTYTNSPFSSQSGNATGYALDSLQIEFI
jgi:hypothetical protein